LRGEHHASFDTVTALEREGADIIWMPVDADGMIDVDAWHRALAESPEAIACGTALAANNEVGTIQPWRELAGMARDAGVPFHLDAIAALGHLPLSLRPVLPVSCLMHTLNTCT
jgi:cysteine desulfurase